MSGVCFVFAARTADGTATPSDHMHPPVRAHMGQQLRWRAASGIFTAAQWPVQLITG